MLGDDLLSDRQPKTVALARATSASLVGSVEALEYPTLRGGVHPDSLVDDLHPSPAIGTRSSDGNGGMLRAYLMALSSKMVRS